jgi:ubiquinone/menaquinone biosynthesis C-methylase UbiE
LSPADARALISYPSLAAGGPQTWADLGAGDGTFTVALASLLPSGSVVHAIDVDRGALKKVPRGGIGTGIVAHAGDFTTFPWPFDALDGLLMANSLHYVADRAAFLQHASAHLKRRQILLVEYDTSSANAWVPYPLSYREAVDLFRKADYDEAIALGRRRSRYRRADIYGALFRQSSRGTGARSKHA